MSARRFRDLVLDRWWIVILSVACVGLGTVGVTLFTPPTYQATSLVQVDIPATDPTVLVGVTRIVYTQAQLATSDSVFADIIGRHGDLTPAKLQSEVSATPVANANLIQITVHDTSPSLAATIADEVARTLISQQARVLRANNTTAQQSLRDTISATNTDIDSTTTDLSRLTATKGDPNQIASLRTKLDALNAQLTQQEAALSALQIDQAKKSIYMHLARTARVNPNPVRASYLLNIGGGLLFGLLLGLIAIALLDLLSQRIRSAQELEDLIEAPALAALSPNALEEQPLRALATQAAQGSELTQLTKALAFLSAERPLRTIALTSVRSHPARAELTARLAIISATEGQLTLLIDGDFAHASQQRRFGLEHAPGLSDAIIAYRSANTPKDEIARYGVSPATIHLPSLRVLPAGVKPPNVAGLLASRAADHLFMAIETSPVQSVLIDSPPLLGRDRASGLCARADGVILLVDLATARRYDVMQARARLADAGILLLGCVVIAQRRMDQADSIPRPRRDVEPRQGSRRAADVSALPTMKHSAADRARIPTSQIP